MTPRERLDHWIAQDGRLDRPLGYLWIGLGSVVFFTGLFTDMTLAAARDGLLWLVGPTRKP